MKIGENELKAHGSKNSGLTVQNLSVKKFRSIMKRKDPDINVFQLVPEDNFETKSGLRIEAEESSHPGLKKMLQKYRTVFREELPSGTPPRRNVDLQIQTEKNAKPPHRPLHQLSPVELKAMQGYVQELFDKGKIRPSKWPYGAPLFFVKEIDKPFR